MDPIAAESAASVDVLNRHRLVREPTRVSIIIVNHNSLLYLRSCLLSLFATATNEDDDFEIIVVDNGSADGEADAISSEFLSVTVCRSDNVGFGAGCNLGAAVATGEYLIFLNPDTIVTPGWWQALVKALQDEPAAALATSCILLADAPDVLNTAGNDIHLSGLTLCHGMGRSASSYAVDAEVGAVSGAAFAIRRDRFESLGGFDPVFFLYMEETDLSLRARLAGFRCVYVSRSVIYHHYALRFGRDKMYHQERNRYRMLLKNLRLPTMVVLFPALLMAELVTWGFVVVGDRPGWTGKLRAYASLFLDWRDVRAVRQQTQAMRTVPDAALLAVMTPHLDFAQTGKGSAAKWAARVFNPMFGFWHRVVLRVVRW